MTAFGRAELDISDAAAVAAAMAGVHTGSDSQCRRLHERRRRRRSSNRALDGNAFGVRTLARAARTHGATLVHYSSDFVFDGRRLVAVHGNRSSRSSSVYAASKLLGEWFALDAPRAYVLRVESLFGQSAGWPRPRGGAAGDPQRAEGRRLAESVRGSHHYAVVRHRRGAATRQLVEAPAPTGLYHCVNSGQCTWLEFAHEMARLLGLEPRFIPVRMADMQLRAARPQFCALSNAKLRSVGIDMPTWQDGLARYFSALPAGA